MHAFKVQNANCFLLSQSFSVKDQKQRGLTLSCSRAGRVSCQRRKPTRSGPHPTHERKRQHHTQTAQCRQCSHTLLFIHVTTGSMCFSDFHSLSAQMQCRRFASRCCYSNTESLLLLFAWKTNSWMNVFNQIRWFMMSSALQTMNRTVQKKSVQRTDWKTRAGVASLPQVSCPDTCTQTCVPMVEVFRKGVDKLHTLSCGEADRHWKKHTHTHNYTKQWRQTKQRCRFVGMRRFHCHLFDVLRHRTGEFSLEKLLKSQQETKHNFNIFTSISCTTPHACVMMTSHMNMDTVDDWRW